METRRLRGHSIVSVNKQRECRLGRQHVEPDHAGEECEDLESFDYIPVEKLRPGLTFYRYCATA